MASPLLSLSFISLLPLFSSNLSHRGPRSPKGLGRPLSAFPSFFLSSSLSLSSTPFSLAPFLPVFRIECSDYTSWPPVRFNTPRTTQFNTIKNTDLIILFPFAQHPTGSAKTQSGYGLTRHEDQLQVLVFKAIGKRVTIQLVVFL